MTHASFFSGVGGTDLGLERAGWRTVSFSEIEPYACAVLAERWPDVPNLGDIVQLDRGESEPRYRAAVAVAAGGEWHRATLWSGGFPCQDLSVAGKRAGLAGERSGLAFAFLDLVERHRPPAVLLENVPGLLSSYRGRDMAALCGRLAELGYGWAFRVLDARHFGVPQRRRRVFIVGLRSGPDDADGRVAAERAAAVLAVGARCPRHPATGIEAGPDAAVGLGGGAHGSSGHGSAADGATSTRTLGAAMGHHGYTLGAQDADGGYLQVTEALPASIGKGLGHNKDGFIVATADGLTRSVVGANRYDDDTNTFLVSTPPDSGGVRAPDGLAGRLDGGGELVRTLRVGAQRNEDGGPGDTVPVIVQSLDTKRGGADDNEAQAGHLVATPWALIKGDTVTDDPLLPLGLDSHRYRCCGNGVVAPVAEWLGWRLREVVGS